MEKKVYTYQLGLNQSNGQQCLCEALHDVGNAVRATLNAAKFCSHKNAKLFTGDRVEFLSARSINSRASR